MYARVCVCEESKGNCPNVSIPHIRADNMYAHVCVCARRLYSLYSLYSSYRKLLAKQAYFTNWMLV
jgi:hypothetical protein